MKTYLLLPLLLLAVSCGKKATESEPAPAKTIFGKFVNTNEASALPSVDFRFLTLNQEQSAEDVISCNGDLSGNGGLVNGVNERSVLATGTETTGTIQFGHLAHRGASNPVCRVMSRKSYTYSVLGDELTLCNVICVNGVYARCAANRCETFIRE